MKVSEAHICIGCDELFTGSLCPVCGRDDNWVSLVSWIPAMEHGSVVVDGVALERLQRMAGLKE